MLYIYGNMHPINIPPMLAYIPYMDPMGIPWSSLHDPLAGPTGFTTIQSCSGQGGSATVRGAGEGGVLGGSGLRLGLTHVDPKVGSAYCCCEFKAGLDPLFWVNYNFRLVNYYNLPRLLLEKVWKGQVSVSAGWKSLVARHGHFPLPKSTSRVSQSTVVFRR